ncbi:hypothetical protein G7084_03695 [Weissella coleopterorum]|uniref:Uncharacterized protein n=1 Tax=Weissella coleopterorum TaxID=2714949 RepID=A0A6G8AZT3_9LACO|nr:hypothetical protein [Weissella coleopterorum]QIL50497.1 hypothetical protein G7084_03695 [Weissella coleopterorum]
MDFNDIKEKAQDVMKDVDMKDVQEQAGQFMEDNKENLEGAVDKVKGLFGKN